MAVHCAKFADNHSEVLSNLKRIYGEKILEAERRYMFEQFNGNTLRGSDFDAKPVVLLAGQYSVGKTTFIEYLLKCKFPGQRIGPEPTTDKYCAVMYGEEDQIIPGNALSVDPEQPFTGTSQFGSSFLSKFEASKCKSEILKNIIIVDTPGVLSGKKQSLGRSYDFIRVSEWFAEKSDLILLLFDPFKTDISDEFKLIIDGLVRYHDKIRCVLNKCDQIDTQQLMRVYGALMWSLGKVISTPEALRVYVGSFWEKPYHIAENAKLFKAESNDLLADLVALPRNSAVRKVDDLVRRTRAVRTHAHMIAHLGAQMPYLFGKEDKKNELIENLATEFQLIQKLQNLPPGDFPDIKKTQEMLRLLDFGTFPAISERLMTQLNTALTVDLPKLMRAVAPHKAEEIDSNPFQENEWIITPEMKRAYDKTFRSLGPDNLGMLSGEKARGPLQAIGLEMSDLRQIWQLVDFEADGFLDSDEFALAMYLCQATNEGQPVPSVLPFNYFPVSKRTKYYRPPKPTTPVKR